ncbi:MAG: hypothetical protein H6Q33_3052 [Deltaproteobacteria bacterium]|nr:hypothetical protein [Deltaproteobacteria bacterium]MBP1774521.1 hypothetical protein [candidate division NC10 bacterium]
MNINSLTERIHERRAFLRTIASVAGLALTGCVMTRNEAEQLNDDGQEAEVTPGEDLMQEHGVLERILLIYDEVIRRTERKEPFDPVLVAQAAGIVRSFVEDYHEKLEEQFVFSRLQTAQRGTDLVAILLRQHQRGRELTDAILSSARSGAASGLAPILRSFSRMYRPHAAREDTVLFPAFRDVVGRSAYRELGGQFEEREHELFGEYGFRTVVDRVADIERALSIHNLAEFTPT